MENFRPQLTLYAYNILGSYEDAKDIVQDVFLKYSEIDERSVDNPKSYLIRMVVNLAIDRKRRMKKEVKDYPGPWLPEPISTEDPQLSVHRKQILSYSMLVLLEKLNSRQRAVFILKEAFDYDHDEIGRVLGISADNSRKILSRAKNELSSDRNVRPDDNQLEVLKRYLRVLESGDMDSLEQLLSEDVRAASDGGGKAPASRKILIGLQQVGAFVTGLFKKTYSQTRYEIAIVNHQPAVLVYHEGAVVTCQIFSIRDSRIESIYFMRNPDKMKRLRKISQNDVTFSPPYSS